MNRSASSGLTQRVRFQLTPLMDLLLIIVFAQFLDVRETSQQQTVDLQKERQKLTAQIARERSELAGISNALRTQQRQLTNQRNQARADRDEVASQVDVRLSEMQTAMKMISEYFDVDESAITRTKPADDEQVDPVDQAVEKALKLSRSQPDAVIRFLIGHAELLKRAEIWTVHVDENRTIRIEAEGRNESFRLEARSQSERTAEVAERLFAAYKQFPQPKGLVVLLVSFDPQSVAGIYQPLIDAMPTTMERLRSDTPETRFEYTVLGSTPDPF